MHMILGIKSAALAHRVLPQRAAKPIVSTQFREGEFISAWRHQEIADWGGRGGRSGGHRRCWLVKYVQTQLLFLCSGYRITHLFWNLEKAWEEDIYWHFPPVAIAGLVVIHLIHDDNLAWNVGYKFHLQHSKGAAKS